ncbi:hypothetical protein IMCC3317_34230 [Kordia antarctica]|uniref:Uncharacterized protein n=1 Tax=Kordia antarctica TaxID=1218801 RepID=A0A7L4ZNM4_9FLAO|nr:hypothetical protein [Kordia antarctica]QHI38039.1 hypothetical protein IMCC3317_34230 [Kordia antarctica]
MIDNVFLNEDYIGTIKEKLKIQKILKSKRESIPNRFKNYISLEELMDKKIISEDFF